MAKQKKRIAEPWISELDIDTSCFNKNSTISIPSQDKDVRMFINLINKETGEIRQKEITMDQIARRIFESEISNWKDIELEDIE